MGLPQKASNAWLKAAPTATNPSVNGSFAVELFVSDANGKLLNTQQIKEAFGRSRPGCSTYRGGSRKVFIGDNKVCITRTPLHCREQVCYEFFSMVNAINKCLSKKGLSLISVPMGIVDGQRQFAVSNLIFSFYAHQANYPYPATGRLENLTYFLNLFVGIPSMCLSQGVPWEKRLASEYSPEVSMTQSNETYGQKTTVVYQNISPSWSRYYLMGTSLLLWLGKAAIRLNCLAGDRVVSGLQKAISPELVNNTLQSYDVSTAKELYFQVVKPYSHRFDDTPVYLHMVRSCIESGAVRNVKRTNKILKENETLASVPGRKYGYSGLIDVYDPVSDDGF